MNKHEFERRVLVLTDRLHTIALAILCNEADCYDAVQEALVRAWMRLDTLRQPQYFETWLIRILVNECKRGLAKRAKHETSELLDSYPAIGTPDPEVFDALRQLPMQHRLPLVLHYVEGYNAVECAQMLALPKSTVKWRIHQGKKALAALLGKEAQS